MEYIKSTTSCYEEKEPWSVLTCARNYLSGDAQYNNYAEKIDNACPPMKTALQSLYPRCQRSHYDAANKEGMKHVKQLAAVEVATISQARRDQQ